MVLRLIIMSALVYFILVVFKPFGLKEHEGMDLLIYSGGFVFLGLLYLIFHFIIIEPFFNEVKWNVGKEALNNLFILFILGLINAIYYTLYEGDSINIIIIVAFIIYTLLIGIFPVIVVLILRQNSLMKYHIRLARSIQPDRMEANKDLPDECTVELFGLNPEKQFTFNCNDLILVEAQDNYIKLNYISDGKLHWELIRNTMKQCAHDMKHLPVFFRCHRSFIINLEKIKSVEGNAQGIKLKLESIDEKIPVSRHLIREFKSKLLQFTT